MAEEKNKQEVDVFEVVDGVEDVGTLKELQQLINGKIDELRKANAKPWKKASFKMFWNKTSEDVQRLVLQLAENGGSAYKEDLLEKMDWEQMKLTGMLAGVSNKARNMGYKDIVTRENVKDEDGNWHVQYKLDEDIQKFIKEL